MSFAAPTGWVAKKDGQPYVDGTLVDVDGTIQIECAPDHVYGAPATGFGNTPINAKCKSDFSWEYATNPLPTCHYIYSACTDAPLVPTAPIVHDYDAANTYVATSGRLVT